MFSKTKITSQHHCITLHFCGSLWNLANGKSWILVYASPFNPLCVASRKLHCTLLRESKKGKYLPGVLMKIVLFHKPPEWVSGTSQSALGEPLRRKSRPPVATPERPLQRGPTLTTPDQPLGDSWGSFWHTFSSPDRGISFYLFVGMSKQNKTIPKLFS